MYFKLFGEAPKYGRPVSLTYPSLLQQTFYGIGTTVPAKPPEGGTDVLSLSEKEVQAMFQNHSISDKYLLYYMKTAIDIKRYDLFNIFLRNCSIKNYLLLDHIISNEDKVALASVLDIMFYPLKDIVDNILRSNKVELLKFVISVYGTNNVEIANVLPKLFGKEECKPILDEISENNVPDFLYIDFLIYTGNLDKLKKCNLSNGDDDTIDFIRCSLICDKLDIFKYIVDTTFKEENIMYILHDIVDLIAINDRNEYLEYILNLRFGGEERFDTSSIHPILLRSLMSRGAVKSLEYILTTYETDVVTIRQLIQEFDKISNSKITPVVKLLAKYGIDISPDEVFNLLINNLCVFNEIEFLEYVTNDLNIDLAKMFNDYSKKLDIFRFGVLGEKSILFLFENGLDISIQKNSILLQLIKRGKLETIKKISHEIVVNYGIMKAVMKSDNMEMIRYFIDRFKAEFDMLCKTDFVPLLKAIIKTNNVEILKLVCVNPRICYIKPDEDIYKRLSYTKSEFINTFLDEYHKDLSKFPYSILRDLLIVSAVNNDDKELLDRVYTYGMDRHTIIRAIQSDSLKAVQFIMSDAKYPCDIIDINVMYEVTSNKNVGVKILQEIHNKGFVPNYNIKYMIKYREYDKLKYCIENLVGDRFDNGEELDKIIDQSIKYKNHQAIVLLLENKKISLTIADINRLFKVKDMRFIDKILDALDNNKEQIVGVLKALPETKYEKVKNKLISRL